MTLKSKRVIHAPIQRCFDLTRSIDAHVYTARGISGKATKGKTSGLAELGDSTTWSAKFLGLRFKLTTKVTNTQEPFSFSERLERGLFKRFEHDYTLRDLGDGTTELEDAFTFVSPFGWIGATFDNFILQRVLRKVMESRLDDIKQLAENK
jgi:ribosome-associated toxin RatA of RatAB toxin-antitoxin module